jgi:CheY-like chemotaxis protein
LDGGGIVTFQTKSGRKKILVVDDDAADRKLVKTILRSKHSVIVAVDGEQALALAQRHKPDVILLDLMMPKKDGLTACSEIRANPVTKAIPVIMLTGSGYELNEKVAVSLGVNRYITKPVNAQELLDVIDSLSPSFTF